MAVLPSSGRAAIARAIKNDVLHLAWGEGDPAWGDNPPAESVTATGLLSEVGRRSILEAAFVAPDPAGEIEVPGAGRFSRSTAPAPQLYVVTKFDFEDAADKTIREIGLFVGTVVDPALPPGQMYFVPSEIVDPGVLLQIEHRPPIIRSTSTRQMFEMIINF